MAQAVTDNLTDPGTLTDRMRAGRTRQVIGAWALWLLIAAFTLGPPLPRPLSSSSD